MSAKIRLENFSTKEKQFIEKTLVVNETEEIFDVDDTHLFLPKGFAEEHFKFKLEKKSPINIESTTFTGKLRPAQESVAKNALTNMYTKGTILIVAHPGFGKTITSINIACKLNMKTMIIVNKLILIKQWTESINIFCPDKKLQYITSKTKLIDPTADFYIMNAINIKKKPKVWFEQIKLVIIDEIHQLVTKILCQGFFHFTPDYLIGLSATPYRFDEYNKVISWFFGKYLIGKQLMKKHLVYYVDSDFVPDIAYTPRGLDWNVVLNSQAQNEKRNELIVKIVNRFPEKIWLILVKRVVHAEILQKMFGGKCETLLREKINFDKNCKILIGTTCKIGVGFDHSKIDALFIAADVKNYFVQFLGRCMRRPDCDPIVVDLIDNFRVLKKHFEGRTVEYLKHGGSLKELIIS